MGRVDNITFTITGMSGRKYTFDTYTKDTTFNDISAVYIFTKRYKGNDGSFYQCPLYIGESSQLGTRIKNHEKWNCVEENGCTNISILLISNEKERIGIETDLRNGNITPCNDQ